MKPVVGAHQFLWRSHFTDASRGLLDRVRGLGLGLFEISVGDDVNFSAALVGAQARDLGLELTVGPGNLWPADVNLASPEPADRRRGLDWHRRQLDTAAALGASAYCGALYARPGWVLRQAPDPDQFRHAAEGLRALAEHAGGSGVRVVVEPMSRFRTHLVTTALQARRLLEAADHPGLGINLDTYHMVTEERDYAAAIGTCLPWLWGLHCCESDRGVPGGGLVPWAAVFGALRGATRTPRLLLETYRTGPDGFGYERGIFQDLCPDPDAFVRQGLAFLAGHLA